MHFALDNIFFFFASPLSLSVSCADICMGKGSHKVSNSFRGKYLLILTYFYVYDHVQTFH